MPRKMQAMRQNPDVNYAMMNLAKGLLAIDMPDYFQDKANLRHGMTTRYGNKYSCNFAEEKIALLPKGNTPYPEKHWA